MDHIKTLFNSEYGKLLLYAKCLVPEHIAEELVQDVFCHAVHNEKLLSTHPNPQGWLMQTLKNYLSNYLRRESRKQNWISELPLEKAEKICRPYEKDVTKYILQDTIKKMPDLDQKIFQKVCIEEKSYAVAGKELGISPATCTRRMKKIRQFLKKQLES